MKLINLTPHSINLIRGSYTTELPSSLPVPRCTETSTTVDTVDGVTFVQKVYSDVTDVPVKEDGTVYIVSMLVASKLKRADVVCPGDLERDAQGRIVGCKSLVRFDE